MKEESENMKQLGTMIDCGRNCVYTIKALKQYIDLLHAMGYNYLQIYTEDAFEVEGEPHFGYLRGKYGMDELKELDAYARSKDMELIPCIQTLAHLMGVTRWWYYEDIRDTSNILLCGEERTYELIDKMFAACAKCFTSRRINIGMDEAHMVGLGQYLDRHGYEDRFDILLRHLQRVCAIAEKYGFKPMMWSDMFFRLANHGEYRAEKPYALPQKVYDSVPKNVQLVYWDYYSDKKEVYDTQFEMHKRFPNETVFACGAWCWGGFVPHNRWSIGINKTAFLSAQSYGIEDVFVTSWKDDYGESSLFSNLPALYVSAEYFRGNYDMDAIKRGFQQLIGIDFDDYLALDLPDMLDGVGMNNPSKYSLYSDPFLGFMDCLADEKKTNQFAMAKSAIDRSADNAEYGYVFRTVSALCSVLSVKYDLGIRTRRIYKSGDRAAAAELAKQYALLERRVKRLYQTFSEQWDRECKLNGFECHDIRFGGLMTRIRHCGRVLSEYAQGKTDCIPALEEEILPLCDRFEAGKSVNYNHWHATALIKYVDN